MATEIIMALVGLVCTTASSVVTFVLTRRKYNAEVDANQIDNMGRAFDQYKRMTEETLGSQKRLMEATIGLHNKTIEEQNAKIDSLQKENEFLRNQVNELQMQLIKFFGDTFKGNGEKTRKA